MHGTRDEIERTRVQWEIDSAPDDLLPEPEWLGDPVEDFQDYYAEVILGDREADADWDVAS